MRTVRVPEPSEVDRAAGVIARHLAVTPVVPAPALGPDVWLKLETLQPTGSFKVRGALVAVTAALADRPDRAIVTASAGNHGLGVAFAAARLGARATIVVPETASEAKLAALERFPITLVRHGDSYDDAELHALALADAGAKFVSPYNDPDVIAGQGTIAVELRAQIPDLAAIVTPIGGGGLASGLGLAAAGTATRVFAAEAMQSRAFMTALAAGEPVPVEVGDTLADGLAGNLEPGSVTFDLVRAHIDTVTGVFEADIEQAMRFLVREHGLIAEGSAAIAVAPVLRRRVALPETGAIAIVLTGRNVSTATLTRVLNG